MARNDISDVDLNKSLSDVIRRGNDMKTRLGELLGMYEELHRQSTRILAEERDNIPAGDVKASSDLNDFQRLVNTVRRNRDVIGSMLRGLEGLRSLGEFKFQEVPDLADKAAKEKATKEKEAKEKKKKAKSAEHLPMRQAAGAEQGAEQPEVTEVSKVTEISEDSLFDEGGNNA